MGVETMKKIPKTIQVDAYTDDDGDPACGECEIQIFDGRDFVCNFRPRGDDFPGPNCPIWLKQDDTGAEDDQP
jgi:hypothetical protein